MPTVDLVDEELLRDPPRGYARIREQAPLVRGVSPGMDPVWLVTRYDDVKMVLSDPRFRQQPGERARDGSAVRDGADVAGAWDPR